MHRNGRPAAGKGQQAAAEAERATAVLDHWQGLVSLCSFVGCLPLCVPCTFCMDVNGTGACA